MGCGEQWSSTTVGLASRRSSCERRPGPSVSHVTSTCAGPTPARVPTFLEELDHIPCVSVPVLGRVLVRVSESSFPNILGTMFRSGRCTRWPFSLPTFSPTDDFFVRSAAGCGFFTIPLPLEMALGYPRGRLRVVLLSLDRRLSAWTPSREFLRPTFTTFLYLDYVRTICLGLAFGIGSLSLRMLEDADAASPMPRHPSVVGVHLPASGRWRASEDPVRHTMRMAGWNAPGWPGFHEFIPRFAPILPPLVELADEAGAACARKSATPALSDRGHARGLHIGGRQENGAHAVA